MSSTAAQGRPQVQTRAPWLAAALVTLGPALAAVVVCWPALHGRAVWMDDVEYVGRNPVMQNPSASSAMIFLREIAAPSTVRGYYHPLAMISLMLDYAVGGRLETPAAFRRTSLALHALNAGLVGLLGWRLLASRRAGLLGGLLFALHPGAVESLAWTAERKNLLAAFFALLSLYAYVAFARGGRGVWYLLSLAAFVPALLSKPAVVPLPLWLLLLDAWPLRRLSTRRPIRGPVESARIRLISPAAALLEKLPFFGLTALFAWITYLSQAATAYSTVPSARDAATTLLTVLHNVAFYVVHWLWPWSPAPYHPHPELTATTPLVMAGAAIVALLPVMLAIPRLRPAGWMLLYFLAGLAPVIGIIGFTNVIAADRFAYLPAVGLVILTSGGLVWTCATRDQASPADSEHSPARPQVNAPPPPSGRRAIAGWVVMAAALLLIGLLAGSQRAYVLRWQETDELWRLALERAPSARLLLLANYGDTLMALQRVTDARAVFEQALAQPPDGNGFYAAAVRTTLADLLGGSGDVPAALPLYAEALRINPASPEAHNSLAWWRAAAADVSLRDGAEAVRLAERAVALRGREPAFLDTLAAAYAQAGIFDAAITTAREALAGCRGRNPALAEEISTRLRYYEARRPLP